MSNMRKRAWETFLYVAGGPANDGYTESKGGVPMDYKWQRQVFKMARNHGWPGYEPSALGTPGSNEAYESARLYLLTLGVTWGMANIWFSGTCKACGVWSPTWDEHSTKQMKCPECGALQDIKALHMMSEKKTAENCKNR